MHVVSSILWAADGIFAMNASRLALPADMGQHPAFPDFVPLDISHRGTIDDALAADSARGIGAELCRDICLARVCGRP